MPEATHNVVAPPRPSRVWLWWVSGSMFGTAIAVTSGTLRLGVLGALLGSSFGALLVVHAVQAMLLHVFVQASLDRKAALRWFNYSVAAGLLGFLLIAPCAFGAIILGVPGYSSPTNSRSHALAATIISALCWGGVGAAIGFAQTYVIVLTRRSVWIMSSAIGWAALAATMIWLLLSANFVQWPLPRVMVIVFGSVIGGALHGLCTGTALVWLHKNS